MKQQDTRQIGRPGLYSKGGKRLLDVLIVLASLPISLPLLAIVSGLVLALHGAPAIYSSQRPGRNGVPFTMVKFRSMTNERGPDGELLPDAERLTRFGQLLRKLSLDELPELWNVLKGDMALVGPRPLLMQYLPLYSEEQFARHEARPGITGLAQVEGRNALDWNEKFALDVDYVRRCSLRLDLWIYWRTLVTVLKAEGIAAEGSATMPAFTGNGEKK